MRYYILNYTNETSATHGNDYYHVNICNENLESFGHMYIPFKKTARKYTMHKLGLIYYNAKKVL